MKKTLLIIMICMLVSSMGVSQNQNVSRQLNVGWNWIGFPHSGLSLEEALATINPVDGDYIKSQTASSTYYEGFGWFGELTHLEPLHGYNFKISHLETLTVRFYDGDGSFTDARDNHTYKWVRIGNQSWMAENLAWLPGVSPSSEGSYTDPYYYVYGYEGSSVSSAKATSNYKDFGVLYNWETANISCPEGWRLPSDGEWSSLTDYLESNGYGYGGSGNDIGKSLASTSGWTPYLAQGTIGNDQASNNSSGFNAYPGGYRHVGDIFISLGYNANFWSSTPDGSPYAWYHYLSYGNGEMYRSSNSRGSGYSVRCLQN